MSIKYLAVFFVILSTTHAEAKYKKMPMSKVEDLEGVNNVLNSIEDAKSLLNKRSREFEIQCLKSTGDLPICECFSSNTPIELSYNGYSYLVSMSKEDVNLAQRTFDEKKLILGALKARKKCIK